MVTIIRFVFAIIFLYCCIKGCCSVFFFFFFQAEDGIRDTSVTGVQTCALPISVRRADPDRPLDAPGNHAVSWDELVHLTQTDLARAFRILRWSGHPSREDIKDRPIPWIESAANGVVPNSFLSGADYAGDHYEPPPGYWP